jgi:hypothetical protein
VRVFVGVRVNVGVDVSPTGVLVFVGVRVNVGVDVSPTGVLVFVGVLVGVFVSVGVSVGGGVPVGVSVGVFVIVGVSVGVGVGVFVAVLVGVTVAVSVGVAVAVGVAVGQLTKTAPLALPLMGRPPNPPSSRSTGSWSTPFAEAITVWKPVQNVAFKVNEKVQVVVSGPPTTPSVAARMDAHPAMGLVVPFVVDVSESMLTPCCSS